MATTAQLSAAYLNRAFNDANSTPTVFATNVADLTASEIAAANKFDVPALTDAALAKQVLTNMGVLPSTVTEVAALESALAGYFAGPGKGNRGFVVLQLARILSDKAADATSAYYAIGTAWNAEVSASVSDATNQTFVLTPTKDTVAGGQGDDIITALVTGLSTTKTLTSTDVISGGAGNDTLKVDVDTAFSGLTTGSVSSVETLELTNTAGSAISGFDAVNMTGITTLTVNAANGSIAVTDLPTGVVTYNINGQKSGTFSASFAPLNTSDVSTINLNGVGATSTVTLSVADVDTATINSTGTNKVTLGGSLADVTVKGSGAITVSDFASTTAKFDASAATGNVTVTTTGAATATNTTGVSSVKTGSGNDTITMSMQDYFANATIGGGAGTDELKLSSTAAATVQYKLSGVETLTFGNVTSGATQTWSGAKSSDVANIKVTAPSTGNVGTVGALNFSEMGAGALNFTALGASTTAVSSDHTGATTINYTASSTGAAAGTSADAADADYTVDASLGALTVNVGAYISDAGAIAISAAKASSVSLTTTSGKDAAGTQLSSYDGVISAAAAATITVDAGGKLSAAAQINAALATSASVTTATTGSSLVLNTAALKSLTSANTGTMTYAGSTLTALTDLTVNAKTGAVTVPALADAANITLSGAGTSSAVTLSTLGTTSNDHDLTLTATGLKAGLNVGTVSYTAGNSFAAKLTGTTGSVDFADIGTSSAKLLNVTITADGTKAVDTDAIYATGDVVINASNTTSASTIDGTVYGTNVTAKVDGSGIGSTIPTTVYADTSVTLAAHELAPVTTYNIYGQGSSTKTALTVNFTGGMNAETVNVTGAANQTAITLTGDLAGGADVVLVDSRVSTAAQTISLANLASYATSTVYGNSGADTITGGVGADTIYGGNGADILTGGAGVDTFVFNDNNSTYLAPDTITDLQAIDQVVADGQTATVGASLGTSTTITTNAAGVVSFVNLTASAYDTFAEKVSVIDAVTAAGQMVYFADAGSTYMFIDTGTATNDVVVKLTGVSLPLTAATAGTTGLTGVGAA